MSYLPVKFKIQFTTGLIIYPTAQSFVEHPNTYFKPCINLQTRLNIHHVSQPLGLSWNTRRFKNLQLSYQLWLTNPLLFAFCFTTSYHKLVMIYTYTPLITLLWNMYSKLCKYHSRVSRYVFFLIYYCKPFFTTLTFLWNICTVTGENLWLDWGSNSQGLSLTVRTLPLSYWATRSSHHHFHLKPTPVINLPRLHVQPCTNNILQFKGIIMFKITVKF